MLEAQHLQPEQCQCDDRGEPHEDDRKDEGGGTAGVESNNLNSVSMASACQAQTQPDEIPDTREIPDTHSCAWA
jgi:hypothetical protein